jgi:hypothetical protein
MLTLNISNTCPNSACVTKPSFSVHQVQNSYKLCGEIFVCIKACIHFLRHRILPLATGSLLNQKLESRLAEHLMQDLKPMHLKVKFDNRLIFIP